jgi:predicted Zn-dependent peptidase
MKFFTTELENGLTIIGEENPVAQSSALSFFVKTGARDEAKEIWGVSHFLEHMMFKGTSKRSALEVTYDLGAIGAQANAYTSEENTVYYTAILPEYFRQAIEILSDMLRPSLDINEFNTEKKVILEEIALYKDRPTHLLFEASLKEHFKNHPAGNPVLGNKETIAALSRDQMHAYFDTQYCPSNMVLGASGAFSWDLFVELAKGYCGAWKNGKKQREVFPHQPTQTTKVITKENLQRGHACLIAPGPQATDDSRYAAYVLSTILGDASGSRVYWELIDKGLADVASIDVDLMEGTGIVYGYVSSDLSRIDEVIDILRNILETSREFSEEDLERAKTKLATSVVLQGESPMRRLMAIGNDWLYRKQYATLGDECSRIQNVSRNDIYEMLEQYTFSPATIVKLLPQ